MPRFKSILAILLQQFQISIARKVFGADFRFSGSSFFRILTSEFRFYILGNFLLLPFLSSVLKIRDSLVGLIALTGNIFAYIFQAFANTPHMFYIGMSLYILIILISLQ